MTAQPFDFDALVDSLNRRKGLRTTPTTLEVEKGMIAKFARAVGDLNPIYFDAAQARRLGHPGIIAPPTFVSIFMNGHFPEIIVQDLPLRNGLHAQDIVRPHRPIQPGDVITTHGEYLGATKRLKGDQVRLHQASKLFLQDQHGDPVAEIEILAVAF